MLPVDELGPAFLSHNTTMDTDSNTIVMVTTTNITNNETTGLQPPYWSLAETIILPIILIVIMTVSLIGNALVIISVVYFKDMQRKTYVLIANLAVADFGVSLLCMPVSLVTVISGDWIFGDVFCSINGFLEALFLVASIHGLMHISIHKYFQLSKPLRRIVDKKWATIMIVGTWLVAFTVAMAPVVGLTVNEYKPGTSQCGPKFPDDAKGVIHAAYSMLMGFLIPWTVLAFCYGFIFRNIRKHGARMQRNSSMGQRRIFQQQKKITMTLFIVMIVFFICWAPFIIFNIFGFTMGFDNIPIWPNAYCYWFGYLNSAINPVIYGWRNRSFKKAFLEIFHCCSYQVTTIQTENGMVPAKGRASSRRRRILYPPITPSSPDNVADKRPKRFKFERNVSHISIGDSTRRRVVGFNTPDDTSQVATDTNGSLPIILEDPPVKSKASPNTEESSTAHSNPTFVEDDDINPNAHFDAKNSNGGVDIIKGDDQSESIVANVDAKKSEDAGLSIPEVSQNSSIDERSPDTDPASPDGKEVRNDSLNVENMGGRKSSLTTLVDIISTATITTPRDSDNEKLVSDEE
ncbi:histamine H2 receptor-like [Amphiura filiformis]|uniref:histamine H2 receptor-like n=1 Tax=Amphiura filiformis TaxID=82378 RepID=UPI003B222F94